MGNKKVLGINGMGRIGKLSLWQHIGRKYFDEIVVNIGRHAGTSFDDIAHYIERDSTYGSLAGFLYGFSGEPVISDINSDDGTMMVDGIPVRFLREARNPKEIEWKQYDARMVVDTTGQFLDPTKPSDYEKGSIRGHLAAGAEKVVASAPFKIADKGAPMPEDAVTTVMGINDEDYDPRHHKVISNASCTTTCLAHMVKPLINYFGGDKILSASMATVHASTGSQPVLDKLVASGKTDLRKNRSILNNIILTTTGAANALKLVIPEMNEIGFIAESVRIPTNTGSLIILVVNLQEDVPNGVIRRDTINGIYRDMADSNYKKYLHFSEKQNVSSDIIGLPSAACVIEGHETHTRTANASINLKNIPALPQAVLDALDDPVVDVPVTQAVIYGWYDNEMGSYTNMLTDRIISIAETVY